GIDLIWFGVLLGVNMQTSFMHPPFGFALFYLRSVAPAKEYFDKQTARRMAPVTTGQIYWGAVPFVLIQVLMVALIIAFPNLVSGGLGTKEKVDIRNIQIEIPAEENAPGGETPSGSTSPSGSEEQDEAQKALERAMSGDKSAEPATEGGAS